MGEDQLQDFESKGVEGFISNIVRSLCSWQRFAAADTQRASFPGAAAGCQGAHQVDQGQPWQDSAHHPSSAGLALQEPGFEGDALINNEPESTSKAVTMTTLYRRIIREFSGFPRPVWSARFLEGPPNFPCLHIVLLPP